MANEELKLPDLTKKRLGGRPKQAQAELIKEKILMVAADLFLDQGYGAVSIEAVAKVARISKRTFYHRFSDKAQLFGQVVHYLTEQMRPPEEMHLFEGKNLQEILVTLADVVLRASLSPNALALHRLTLAEAYRFPELAKIMSATSARQEAINRISALLEAEQKAGHIQLKNTVFAAEQFLQLVVANPQRRALGLGSALTLQEISTWAKDSVELFLHGCRYTG